MKKIRKTKLILEATVVIAVALALIMPCSTASTNKETSVTLMDPIWEENFDSYTTGSALHGQGGWEAWDNNPDTTAYVSDAQARSSPNSVDIAWFNGFSADITHQFTGVDSGTWTFTTWQYVPSDMEGNSYFILLNTYSHGGPYHWSTQVEISSTDGQVRDFDNPSAWLDLITDQWVELRVEIDFETDSQTIYYNDEELTTKSWTEGVQPGGVLNLAAVDLYADQSPSTSVYYDDFSLEGETVPQPDIEIENIAGGLGFVTADIANTGDANATDVEWSITLDGGLIIFGKETTGTEASITVGSSASIKSKFIFGLGKTTIKVYAKSAEGPSDSGTASATVLLFLIMGVS